MVWSGFLPNVLRKANHLNLIYLPSPVPTLGTFRLIGP
jgi:hypothetical protein